MSQFTYVGTELGLFSEAKNWKKYIGVLLRQHIKGDVLEVGAGLGSNTVLLCHSQYKKWLCLEPDKKNFCILERSIASNGITDCYARNGTIEILNDQCLFDSILYIDVLEHIQDDREELMKSYKHLKVNGNLIVLGPAHQWLFTSFDSSIGHYRRYNKKNLRLILPHSIEIVKLLYLDCVGLLASLGNKLILRRSQPTLNQIKTWDSLMIPISRKLDHVLRYSLGKSILLVGRKMF
jgi:hypothetical protein